MKHKTKFSIAPVVASHHPACLPSQLEPGWLSDSPLPGAVLLPFPRGILGSSFVIPVSSVVVTPLVFWAHGDGTPYEPGTGQPR